jgi:septal ring factor EnvC (AmiA/AmiB activator)
MVSTTDTSFLSPFDGKVSTVEMGEGNKYEIVIYHGDYYVWLTGLTQSLVKKNEVVKKGQPVATIHPNDEIEFLFFKNGTPVDPRSYLECK